MVSLMDCSKLILPRDAQLPSSPNWMRTICLKMLAMIWLDLVHLHHSLVSLVAVVLPTRQSLALLEDLVAPRGCTHLTVKNRRRRTKHRRIWMRERELSQACLAFIVEVAEVRDWLTQQRLLLQRPSRQRGLCELASWEMSLRGVCSRSGSRRAMAEHWRLPWQACWLIQIQLGPLKCTPSALNAQAVLHFPTVLGLRLWHADRVR
mmetsp:Transcript_79937/g.151918  ORF Transcript_79937/g.151918 Transcript_79937/m.151918 type:complete len:206 (-) Transcript_79937:234-851(-)